jgi:hypothetical protein
MMMDDMMMDAPKESLFKFSLRCIIGERITFDFLQSGILIMGYDNSTNLRSFR